MGKTDCVKKLRVIELCEKIECESAVSDKERLCVTMLYVKESCERQCVKELCLNFFFV